MHSIARFAPQRRNSLRRTLETLEARDVPALIGGLDPSFNGTGDSVIADTPLNSIAIQADGKIVAVGSNAGDVIVVRFNTNGTVDTKFGDNGFQRIDFGGGEIGSDVVIQADGAIVVVGSTDAGNGDMVAARLTPAGALDATFNGDGKAILDFGVGGDVAEAVALQTDGTILVVGTENTNLAAEQDFGIVRLTALGVPDITFGIGGFQTVDFGAADFGSSVAVVGNAIVIGGTADVIGANSDFGIARLLIADGDLDNTFDADGKQTVDFAAADNGSAVAARLDGTVVIAGGNGVDTAVAQLTPDGDLDVNFGGGTGKAVLDFSAGQPDAARGVAIDPSGRIVLSGEDGANLLIARLTADGARDTNFVPTTGLLSADINGVDGGRLVVVDGNGRIVAAGTTNGGTDGVVVRVIGSVEKGQGLLAGGSLDGRATAFAPDAAGKLGNPVVTPAGLFGGFAGNVRTAVGDVNGDGAIDAIMVTGPGTPIRFAVVSGADGKTVLIPATAPFAGSESFTGGGFVAAGDMDNDGRAEILLTPDQGGGSRVSIWGLPVTGNATTKRGDFFGLTGDANFRGGCRAAVGDVNGDGMIDVAVAAGFLGGPRIALFDGKTALSAAGTPPKVVNDFFAFPGTDATTLRNGSFVAIGDVNGDGNGDMIFGGGPGGAPRVFILSGALIAAGKFTEAYAAPVANFFVAGNANDRGGIRVSAIDADGDNRVDVSVGSGEGSPARVRTYLGRNFTAPTEPTTVQDLTVFGGANLAGGVFVG